jgi:predicted HD phosphohydrolase
MILFLAYPRVVVAVRLHVSFNKYLGNYLDHMYYLPGTHQFLRIDH